MNNLSGSRYSEATSLANTDRFFVTAGMDTTPASKYVEFETLKNAVGALESGDIVTAFQDTPDDAHIPSEKLVKDSLDDKQDALGFTPEDSADKGAASGYASLDENSKVVENPANATATPTTSKIPIADANGKLDGWVSAASETGAGLCPQLSGDSGEALLGDGTWGAVSGGSSWEVNIETLSAAKTLTSSDAKYQFLDPNGSFKHIYFEDGSIGQEFIIINNDETAGTDYLVINSSVTHNLSAGMISHVIWNGSVWVKVNHNTGKSSIGTALGASADVSATNAVAIGTNAAGSGSYSLALGRLSNTNSKAYSVALGTTSKTKRPFEVIHSIEGGTSQKNSWSIASWYKSTSNNTPIEIYTDGSSSRFVLDNNSSITFCLLVSARDDVSGDCAGWKIDGVIKRGANAASTALVGTPTITVLGKDDVAWDIAVSADTTNGSLKIEVTGDDTNSTRWSVRGDINEVVKY